MKIFTKSIDPTLWKIIQNGPIEITKMVDEQRVTKPFEEWDENDSKRYSLNSKAINCIYCVVSEYDFRKLSGL